MNDEHAHVTAARARSPESAFKHAPYLALLVAVVALMTRRFFTAGIPAGGDSFGLISRSAQGAHGLLSAWSPIGFGAPRTFDLDQLLVLATTVTRNSVITYKVVVGLLLLSAASFTYLLVWRWFGSRLAATLAGTFYVLSPLPVSQLSSGHLNIEIVVALLPLQLLLWDRALTRFSARTAIGLGMAFGLLLLVRPDMVVLSTATFALYFIARFLAMRDRGVWANAIRTTLLASVVAGLLDAYQVVPALAGARASWASGQTLFTPQQLVDHSVSAYQSLAGLSQETGYLGYMHLPFASGHPWLSYYAYIAFALLPFVLAVVLLQWRGEMRVKALMFVGLCATFLSKGIRGPVGGLYAFAIHTAQPLRNFRDPDRWNVIQALAFSVLAALAIDYVWKAIKPSPVHRKSANNRVFALLTSSAPPVILVGALVALLMLPSMPTLAHGLATYRLEASQTQLLQSIRSDKSEFITATAPYGATYRFIDQRGYRGYEQDLGTDSSIFTGHEAIGDGDWGGRGPSFITYSHELLSRRDPAFVRLLAANNVKYIASLNYSGLAAHYTTNASGEPDLSPAPHADQRAVSSMTTLSKETSNKAGTIFAIPDAASVVSAQANVATVFGGFSALAEMADTTGIDLRDWSAVTVGDAIDIGGLDQVADLVNRSGLVYVGDTGVADVALAALNPVARVPGILSGLSASQPEDALAASGQLTTRADDDTTDRPAVSTVTTTARGPLELWVRAQLSTVPSEIATKIDGDTVGNLLPLSAAATGFHWVRAWQGSLPPGRHTIRLASVPSDVGVYANVTQAVVVRPQAREAAESRVRSMLDSAAQRTIYAADPSNSASLIPESALKLGAVAAGSSSTAPFWSLLDDSHAELIKTTDPAGGPAAAVRSSGGRKYFAVAWHPFTQTQNWSNYDYFLVQFYGNGDGQRFEIDAYDNVELHRAPFAFVDNRRGWRTLAFAIPHGAPGSASVVSSAAPLDWSKITALKLTTPTKSSNVSIQLGGVSLSRTPANSTTKLDVSQSAAFVRPVIVAGSSSACPAVYLRRASAGAATYAASLPASLGDLHCRVVIRPDAPLAPSPSPSVRTRKTGETSYDIQVASSSPVVVQFARSFDTGWKLTGAPGVASALHLPTNGLQNGYFLKPGSYSLQLRYGPDHSVPRGVAVSLAALAAALLAVALLTLRSRSARARAVVTSDEHVASPPIPGRTIALGWALTVVLAGAGVASLVFANATDGRWALFIACLIAPVTWRVYWLLALAASAELVLATYLGGRAHTADTMAVVAIFTALRVVVSLLLRPRVVEPRRRKEPDVVGGEHAPPSPPPPVEAPPEPASLGDLLPGRSLGADVVPS